MQVITKEEYKVRSKENVARMRVLKGVSEGQLFIYPTDTIYGLGCNALNSESVRRLRDAKQRRDLPLSVLAPSKDWIRANFEVTPEVEEWLGKLPGPHTLMLKLRNKDAVAPEVHAGTHRIGVRIPDHWFSKIAEALDIPLVISSANVAGKAYMTSLDDLDPELGKKLDFVLYEGDKDNKTGQVVDLTR
jgi:L-threonylcarbamoyladenylate synthase